MGSSTGNLTRMSHLDLQSCGLDTDVTLKRLRHDNFAVSGQFCVKIITYFLYSYTKCSCKTTRKISNEFCQRELTIIFIVVIFEDMASKREKIGPIFSSFNPFPSLPSVATDDRKQFQCGKTVLNNKTKPFFIFKPYFWNSTDAKTPFSF